MIDSWDRVTIGKWVYWRDFSAADQFLQIHQMAPFLSE